MSLSAPHPAPHSPGKEGFQWDCRKGEQDSQLQIRDPALTCSM